MENPNRKCLIYIGVAPFQETSICFQMGMVHGRNETLLSPSCKTIKNVGALGPLDFWIAYVQTSPNYDF
jgi:hypothetical protein